VTDRTVIIGAGPAGLTAAYELSKIGLPAVVLEKDEVVGGLSRTVSFDGYRFDIGGHRFFTKLPSIRAIWHDLLEEDLLARPRLSRIYYDGKLFDYPLRPLDALRKIGGVEAVRIVLSYLNSQIRRHPEEKSFEDWVVNRFGRRLYEIFFKSYTEKVWGMPCDQISSDWAAQRIKNLDLGAAIRNALLGHRSNGGELVSTLIDRFEYPRFGPGMMWETCRDRVARSGIETITGSEVTRLLHSEGRVTSASIRCDGSDCEVDGTNFISSMPLPSLLRTLDPAPPADVLARAASLRYRDFMTVVLMVDRADVFPDNWIYIHEPTVQVGRVQNFKNWSPEMVPDSSRTSLGLEYFVQETDELWETSDEELGALATRELAQLDLVEPTDVVGSTVLRVPKAYPVYEGDFRASLEEIKEYLASFDNLHLVGRNGQHRYNNQDHSMLTGILAARSVAGESHDVWSVNVDESYHEAGADEDQVVRDRLTPSPVGEPRLEELSAAAFARYDQIALGSAVGLVSAGLVFLATAVLLIRGGDPLGPTLSLLGQYLLGYQVSWAGAFVGATEAGLGGFLFGYVLAQLINMIVSFAELSVVSQCQLEGAQDPLEPGETPGG